MAGDNTNESGSNNNNNKSGQKRNSNRRNNNSNKRSKKDVPNTHHTRKHGFDENKDDRDKPPHEGSFAFEGMRQQFGVSLEPRTIIGEDQNTLKRKVALLLGFVGTKYAGFQINGGQRSIQAEIELALYRAGMISDMNFGKPHKYSWSMSARTDKGVHACAQVCSLKVELFETEVQPSQQQLKEMEKQNIAAVKESGEDVEKDVGATKRSTPVSSELELEAARKRLEEYLPPDIRVMDMLRTTRNMCAKTQRDRVRYQYMIPSFMLQEDWKQVLTDQGITVEVKQEGEENAKRTPLTEEQVAAVKTAVEGYRSTEEQRSRLQAALDRYKGTNPFHNFTKGLQPGQPQANRFIEYFRMQDPIVIDGVEWIPTQVLGQSFLLHQIRKMISMAIDVARGAAPLEIMDKALNKTERVRVGIAPAQGLFLEMSFFGGYNRRKAQNQDLPNLDWSQEGPAKERWKAFRHKIRQHIVEEEKQQSNFIQYMFLQEYYNFTNYYKEALAGKITEPGAYAESSDGAQETKPDDTTSSS
ncbi:unnamed protein product [Cylindrotheca closterium]|uniref:Pseudouridine synthase I TruA alpha/beta domain-containing protein n=1 Tax=Cylindrotheca closterium TaxID=2856 RepID=A0AAD2JM50_9STRA|nr:unnamed protein product [Cylindrotheca closterium]